MLIQVEILHISQRLGVICEASFSIKMLSEMRIINVSLFNCDSIVQIRVR